MTREEALAWLKARTVDDMPSILAGKPILIKENKCPETPLTNFIPLKKSHTKL